MVTEGIWLALIVAVPATLSPLAMAWFTARTKREEREQDWARQDIVAARLLVSNKQVAENTRITNGKLDVIHMLVNSNMTAAMQNEHDAVIRELAMMREVIDLKRAAGQEPSIEVLAAIEATEAKIAELKIVLSERLNAAAKVDG